MLFFHPQENCVKIWRVRFGEEEEKQQSQTSKLQRAHSLLRGGSLSSSQPEALTLTSPPLPRHVPLLFHCDRLTSSADLNLIHFFDHQ